MRYLLLHLTFAQFLRSLINACDKLYGIPKTMDALPIFDLNNLKWDTHTHPWFPYMISNNNQWYPSHSLHIVFIINIIIMRCEIRLDKVFANPVGGSLCFEDAWQGQDSLVRQNTLIFHTARNCSIDYWKFFCIFCNIFSVWPAGLLRHAYMSPSDSPNELSVSGVTLSLWALIPANEKLIWNKRRDLCRYQIVKCELPCITINWPNRAYSISIRRHYT